MKDNLPRKNTSTASTGKGKNIKVEYLSNHVSDLPQIKNLSSGDQNKIQYNWKKTTLMKDDLQLEDNLKIIKVEYLSNWLDLP